MNNETRRIVGLLIISFLILATPARAANIESNKVLEVQKLKVAEQPVLNLVKVREIEFSRAKKIEIVEESPQLKPQNKDYIMNSDEIISVLRKAGFSGESLKMAWAIVIAESTGRPYAHNDNPSTGDNSYGLFQINMRGAMGPDRREKYNLENNNDLFDPLTNAKVAFKMSNGGTAWGPWTTQQKALQMMHQFPG